MTASALALTAGLLGLPGCDAEDDDNVPTATSQGPADEGSTGFQTEDNDDESTAADDDSATTGAGSSAGSGDDDPAPGSDGDPSTTGVGTGDAGDTGDMGDTGDIGETSGGEDVCEGLSNPACAANEDCFWQVTAQDGETTEQCVSDPCPALPQLACDLQPQCAFDPVLGCTGA